MYQVKFAVYGALHEGNPKDAKAVNATIVLQQLLYRGTTVTINNETLSQGYDPAPGETKHFGAVVTSNDEKTDHYFACQEGQTIDFSAKG
jgi:hypothetical protein